MAYLHTTVRCKVKNLETGRILSRRVKVDIHWAQGNYHGEIKMRGVFIGFLRSRKCKMPGCRYGAYRIVAGTITHINEKTIEDWNNGLRVY